MPQPSVTDLTQFLVRLGRGQGDPNSTLMGYVYEELRATAVGYMRNQGAEASLQPTMLVHKAYLKLFDRGREEGARPIEWNDRIHFFATAARAMRQILVDHARKRRSSAREAPSVVLDQLSASSGAVDVDLIDLDDALVELAELDERESRVVELRYFGGLSIAETATVLGVSHATVERDWATARAWLGRRLIPRHP